MRRKTLNLILPFIIRLILVIPITANAQKLPYIQANSLLLPTTAKVDGKSTEWNDQFQANNHSTDIYYTIANNKNVLYLIIQAKDPLIAKKIIGGGVTFTVNTSGAKSTDNSMGVLFPILADGIKSKIASGLNDLNSAKEASAPVNSLDSILSVINKLLTDNAKEINVKGSKSLTDTLLSVYNADGIKAMALFDNKGALTYELSITLKQLNLSINNPSKFSYNVRLNGVTSSVKPVIHQTINGPITVTTTPRMGVRSNSESSFQIMNYVTDFWGEYTLAVK